MKNLEKKLEILKLLFHLIRIKILKELRKENYYVSDLIQNFKVPQSTISQHLSVMLKEELVDYYI